MGEDWSKFMQRVAKLNEEGEDVKKKRDAADRRVLDAQIAVQRHKSESKELSDRLAEIQEEQKVSLIDCCQEFILGSYWFAGRH